jgi:hypothetical protein
VPTPAPAGERHGTPAERLLAAQRRANQAAQSRPHTLFATGPRQQPQQHLADGGGPPPAPAPGLTGFAAGAPMAPHAPPPGMGAVRGTGQGRGALWGWGLCGGLRTRARS